MIRARTRHAATASVMTLIAMVLVVIAAPPAQAATVDGYATAWFVRAGNPAADYFNPYVNPTDPPNPLGPSDNLCQDSTFATNVFELTFGSFAIPAGSTIDGVEVTIDAGIGAGDSPDVTLTDGSNANKSDTKNFTPPPAGSCAATTTTVLGSSTDDWNTTLTDADFVAGNFGVRIAGAIFMDSINIKVHYTPGGNQPPTADAGGPYTVPEGGSVGLDGTGSSDLDGDPLTYAWDLDNDGMFDDATGATPTFSAAGFDGPDSQTIRLRVNDGTVDSAPDSTTVTITNVAPVITSITVGPATIDEAQSVTVSGTFTDPAAALETHTGTAIWSDGASTPLTVGDSTFSTSRTFPDDDPTGTPSDTFTVAITIDDGDGGSDTETSPTLTVDNVDPSIGSIGLSAASIDEGDSVTVSGTFTDPGVPDTFAGSSLWSDGASTAVTVGAGTFSTSRTFVDDDPTGTPSDTFTVDVTITDDDTGSDTATSPTLTVNNVDPVITSLSVTPMIDEDGTVSLSGTFTDAGVADTHTVTVDWGEGAPEAAAVVQGAGSGTFSASHQYLDDDPSGTPQDTYTVTVTVTDDDTGSDTGTVDTLVKNVAPVITSLATDATFDDKAAEGDVVTVTGTFTDVGTLDTHTATIDWGDGTVTPAPVGAGTFSGSHAYAAGGVYTVEVTLIDDDTGSTSSTTTAVVSGVGVNGGVLQIVGTDAADHVEVKKVKGEIDVFADFLDPQHRRFDLAGITSVEVWLCDGDDHGEVHTNLSLPAAMYGGEGDDLMKGGSGPDFMDGGAGDDQMWGRNGADEMHGGDDDDFIDGGKGDDSLFGEDGDDSLFGRAGNDLLDGGPGTNKLKP